MGLERYAKRCRSVVESAFKVGTWRGARELPALSRMYPGSCLCAGRNRLRALVNRTCRIDA